jgi:hypothetical protein
LESGVSVVMVPEGQRYRLTKGPVWTGFRS